ncbi:MAG: holo-ACP synthase [Oscillospiraceae bacterium]
MIYGIGIDTATISRIEKSMEKESFLNKCFSEKELSMFRFKGERAETLAANFAAKEAFGKACGTGIFAFNLRDIQALREDSGKPYFEFCGKALEFINEKNLRAHLSLTHEGGFASAFVILEAL